jgi:NDP-sugar pyrophosphorylase family protein
LTKGAACTCLIAKSLINSSKPLIITNCDQIMEWNSEEFLKECNKEIDGVVVTYKENTPKNSYVMIDKEGFATKFAEKEVISNHSLNGIHYWKKGSDFVKSAEKMIKENIRVNNEFYIAPTYNQMIEENKKITIYKIERKSHHPVGTPEDLKKYENFKNGKYD